MASNNRLLLRANKNKKDEFNYGYPYINGKKTYARLLIRHKKSKRRKI